MKAYLSMGEDRGDRSRVAAAVGAGPKTYLVAGGESSSNASTRAVGSSARIYLSDSKGRGGDDVSAVGANVRAYQRPVRLLLSYHYYKDENLDDLLGAFQGIPIDVFSDSGAFSAMTLGTTVDPKAYIEWVQRWRHHFTCAAGPDVIGDPEATTRETERMIGEVPQIPILPTFHVGEDWKYLDYWQGKVDYMAFGGMVPLTRQRQLLKAWLDEAWTHVAPSMRVHGFGMTTWEFMLRYPWYSVDSSSWTAGFRFAQVALFDEKLGRFVTVDMRNRSALLKMAPLARSYGLRPTQMTNTGYDRDLLCGALVESWQRAEAWLEKRKAPPSTSVSSDRTRQVALASSYRASNQKKCYLVTWPNRFENTSPAAIAQAVRNKGDK